MDCLILPVSTMVRKCYPGSNSRLGYRPLTGDGFGELDGPVTVVVGKEKKEFLVDPFVLEESPFRLLIEMVNNIKGSSKQQERFLFGDHAMKRREKRSVIFVDVDAILFEHMLWLMNNDSSSLLQLNLKEIIDFYTQDY